MADKPDPKADDSYSERTPALAIGGPRLAINLSRINSRANASTASRKLLLPGVEQFIDDLLERGRINMKPDGLCNFPDRVVGRRHAWRFDPLGRHPRGLTPREAAGAEVKG